MKFEIIKNYTGIADVLSDLSHLMAVDPYNNRQRVQLEEIDKILQREQVKTVYREEYIDRHFIHDFCGHYGSCFQDYPKKCIRLHFFTKEFDLNVFKKVLVDYKHAEDWRSNLGEYIGFIVLRPIPQAILGNVSLKAPSDNEDNHYLKKGVKSHFCGLELEVPTIPFQEQDNAISACATSALWMSLQAITPCSGSSVPSPHKLTANARKVMEEGILSHKVAKGLTMSQMARAVKEEHFEPLVCMPHSTSYAKSLIKAYLNAGIPVVLGIELYFRSDSNSECALNRVIGNHAVTVLGWREGIEMKEFDAPDLAGADSPHLDMEETDSVKEKERAEIDQLYLQSSLINGIYCHDDQIGPYSLLSIPDEYSLGFPTEWTRIYSRGPVDARISTLLVPCHAKVRIRFANIYDIVKTMNRLLFSRYRMMHSLISWDIRLETVCSIKNQILHDALGVLNDDIKFELLSSSLPRFIWVVDMFIADEDNGLNAHESVRVASFLFDATDIQNSDYLIKAIHYTDAIFKGNFAFFQSYSDTVKLDEIPYIVRKLREHYIAIQDSKIIVNR